MHLETHPSPFHPVVLIPAYKPDERLPALVALLRKAQYDVLVVDDGGGEEHLPIFERCAELGAPVVRHAVNLGKGRALKTGLNEILLRWPQVSSVITADADGQHTPEDIQKVAEAQREHPNALILGGRAFSGKVPWKSRAGNAITRAVYRIATGIRVFDTQTGLRALPREALPWMLELPGEHYEYEMNMLLKLRERMMAVLEVPIQTVYIDENASSHFHPFRDAARIYWVIFRYMFAALFSFAIDYTLYLLGLRWISALTPPAFAPYVVLSSYAVARLFSSLLNYALNKHTVFGGHGGRSAIVRYYLLAAAQMALGASLTSLITDVTRLQPGTAKLPVDVLLFCVSYFVQRDFVFKIKKRNKSETAVTR
jgi:glycosyltransferase involved in cell wall biosynthesis